MCRRFTEDKYKENRMKTFLSIKHNRPGENGGTCFQKEMIKLFSKNLKSNYNQEKKFCLLFLLLINYPESSVNPEK